MKVSDVMTRDVVSARPATSYKEAVDLLVGHDVSALPVLDDLGRVIGIVSEADFVPIAARRKAHARNVGDVMTTRPVVLHPEQDVSVAARTLVGSRHKSAPVVDATDSLVGIVSRQDLLGAYVRPDDVIAADVAAALADPTRTPEGNAVAARVVDGVVTLSGRVVDDDDRRVVAAAAWRAPGVIDVVDEVTVSPTARAARG